MKIKKALAYFISFFSLSLMFSVCYYLSYKHALNEFNENAVERNKELILSLENSGLLKSNQPINENTANNKLNQNTGTTNTDNNIGNESVPVDTVTEDTILPSTQYVLQTYDILTGVMNEELLPAPSYLVGLNRKEVIEYLYNFMQDLPWSEYEKGLMSFEVMSFGKDKVILRKTYNEDIVVYEYFIKSQNGDIVVYYSDQKTVYDYTGVSVDNLTQYEKLKLEEGFFVKDQEQLYALLEDYSS